MGMVRQTKSVKSILKVFEARNTPISAVELIELFSNQMNKSTVYRILERLQEASTLHSFIGKDGVKWYAVCHCLDSSNHQIHPHFQCNNCGKIECLPINISVPQVAKYNIESASLLLSGKCTNCTS